MDNKYLNYTHGMFLQDLCSEILNLKNFGEDHYKYIDLIEQEKNKLSIIDSPVWGIPISYHYYYKYLEKILITLLKDKNVFVMQSLLDEIKILTRRKINVLFLAQEPSCWLSLKSVFDAAQNNLDYETTLVYTPFKHENFLEEVDYFSRYKDEMGLPIINYNQYQLDIESPDLIFMIKPYANVPKQFQIGALESIVPRIIYIAYGMEITEDLAKFGYQYYTHYRAWKHCAYGEIVKKNAKKYGYRNGENIAVWGHPKADVYRDIKSIKNDIPQEWKDIIGSRKTILWTPHHLINLDNNSTGTWLIWGEKILELAVKSPEVVFIFRPHPLMFGALISNGYLTLKDVEKIKQKIQQTPNIILDTNDTYYYAMAAADAIITDGTTFSIEFLYSKQPILLTPRNMEAFYIYDKMKESYYIVNQYKDIADFINMIKNNQDPLLKKRLELYQEIFFIPENMTVGQNIMKNVKKELDKENKASFYLNQLKKQILINANKEKEEIKNNTSMNLPMVSILVLCYKNSELLNDMLESIFLQDYPRIQLIVSDDGSADFQIDRIEKYIQINKGRNIEEFQILKNEENMGTVKHIDKVCNLIKGDYFIFTAADDRYVGRSTITSYVNAFIDSPSSIWLVAKCSLTTSDYRNILYTTPTLEDEPYFLENNPRKIYSRWSRRGLAIPCQMAFSKKVLEIIGGIDPNYIYLEDWPMIIKLLRKGHAPIYLDKVVALHSTGGISNSNERYGKELRKAFYADKYTFFKREVEPYKHLLYPEDLKAYKLYKKEIMNRHYFFYIDYPDATIMELCTMILKKPIRFWWLFERFFIKYQDKIKRKQLLAASHIILLLALIFLKLRPEGLLGIMMSILAYFEIFIAALMGAISIISFPLKQYFHYKGELRKKLVN